MALDQQNHRLFVVTRFPARLIVLDTVQGRRVAALSAIGDCDDVFYDQQRHRIYAIGGEGGSRCSSNGIPTTMTNLAESRRSACADGILLGGTRQVLCCREETWIAGCRDSRVLAGAVDTSLL
jgi:hypothetical protein